MSNTEQPIQYQIINDEVWVFLSHSHKDYDKVILVRNMLEQRNYKPIMFFLKCLENDTEIDSLIKREIDCRDRFILCDSKNARQSAWVQEEVKYIREKKNQYYEVVDLEAMSEKEIEKTLSDFEKRSTVTVLSGSMPFVRESPICKDLVKYNYRVRYGDITSIVNDKAKMLSVLEESALKGYVLLMCDYKRIVCNCLLEALNELCSRADDVIKLRIVLYYGNDKKIAEAINNKALLSNSWFNEMPNWDIWDFIKITKNKNEIAILTDQLWGEERVRYFESMIDDGKFPVGAYSRLSHVYEFGEWGVPINYQIALNYLYCLRAEGISIDKQYGRIMDKMELSH